MRRKHVLLFYYSFFLRNIVKHSLWAQGLFGAKGLVISQTQFQFTTALALLDSFSYMDNICNVFHILHSLSLHSM